MGAGPPGPVWYPEPVAPEPEPMLGQGFVLDEPDLGADVEGPRVDGACVVGAVLAGGVVVVDVAA